MEGVDKKGHLYGRNGKLQCVLEVMRTLTCIIRGKKVGRWSVNAPLRDRDRGTGRKLSFEGRPGRVHSEGQKRQLDSTSAGEGRRWEPTKVAGWSHPPPVRGLHTGADTRGP